jgi:Lon protease-like protein
MVAGYVYRKPSDLPAVIPVFPLTGALLFPRGQLPLNIFEPRYLNLIDDALAGNRLIGMIQADGTGDPEKPGLSRVGCVGKLTSFAETDDGRYLVTLTGICRFAVAREYQVQTPYRQVTADWTRFAADLTTPRAFEGFDRTGLLEALRAYLDRNNLNADWSSIDEAQAEPLVNALSALCPFVPIEKQALLEAQTIEDRRDVLIALMEMDQGGHDDDDSDEERPFQ